MEGSEAAHGGAQRAPRRWSRRHLLGTAALTLAGAVISRMPGRGPPAASAAVPEGSEQAVAQSGPFASEQEVYDTVGATLKNYAEGGRLRPQFNHDQAIVQIKITEPEAALTLYLRDRGPGALHPGATDLIPEATTSMSGATAHAILSGDRDVASALATGDIQVVGERVAAAPLVSFAQTAQAGYREALIAAGRSDLASEPPNR
jgi:hypothetical protein